jgi:ABA responsive element binding factor
MRLQQFKNKLVEIAGPANLADPGERARYLRPCPKLLIQPRDPCFGSHATNLASLASRARRLDETSRDGRARHATKQPPLLHSFHLREHSERARNSPTDTRTALRGRGRGGGRGGAARMASSRVMPSSSPSHTASDLACFAQAASKPGGGGGSGLGSMNMEELLRGIYNEMPTPGPPPAPVVDGNRTMSPAPAPEIGPRRTAEEVWKDITRRGGSAETAVPPPAPPVVNAGGGGAGSEMTLEDFLAREGAVKEDEATIPEPSVPMEGQVTTMGFLSGPETVTGRGSGRGRKRQLMDPVDRAAMQRQKRMIKNRESAARSRERKQVRAQM